MGYNSKKLPAAARNYSITELELFGLVINVHAFKEQLTGIYFECYCDHSALTYILNSKRPIVTNRLDRLVRALNKFNFSIYYLPGQKMHVADVLSHLAGHDIDPPDKVIPISFNALKNLPPCRTLPQRTRQPPHQQLFTIDKLKPSQIPSCYKPQQAQSFQTQRTTQTTTRLDKRSTSLPSRSRRQKDTHFPLTPPISQSSINISQVPDHLTHCHPLHQSYHPLL